MELDLIKLMCYGFGSAIILLFIYITALAVFFIKHIRSDEKQEDF